MARQVVNSVIVNAEAAATLAVNAPHAGKRVLTGCAAGWKRDLTHGALAHEVAI
jgi:hypothetical protein